ncbi:hypothetical protein KQH49_06890 [Mycetohabitans sp. B5]|uniref:Uncharacterized protein n=1 Tax=Mycetohabitans endofungorum TaxID=417203 RepID=A0A2P5KA22_9BURK|nr:MULTISPECIES: hypothetical protein [Mycetohabitans]MCG1054696.1 hypothetical protein [Mycetohabitans sp. B5]PPB83557.1 hypothetical protein B0O95_10773 [Mycetohabitans endofungorum]
MNNANDEGMTIVKKFELIDDQFIEEPGVELLRIRVLISCARVCGRYLTNHFSPSWRKQKRQRAIENLARVGEKA